MQQCSIWCHQDGSVANEAGGMKGGAVKGFTLGNVLECAPNDHPCGNETIRYVRNISNPE